MTCRAGRKEALRVPRARGGGKGTFPCLSLHLGPSQAQPTQVLPHPVLMENPLGNIPFSWAMAHGEGGHRVLPQPRNFSVSPGFEVANIWWEVVCASLPTNIGSIWDYIYVIKNIHVILFRIIFVLL